MQRAPVSESPHHLNSLWVKEWFNPNCFMSSFQMQITYFSEHHPPSRCLNLLKSVKSQYLFRIKSKSKKWYIWKTKKQNEYTVAPTTDCLLITEHSFRPAFRHFFPSSLSNSFHLVMRETGQRHCPIVHWGGWPWGVGVGGLRSWWLPQTRNYFYQGFSDAHLLEQACVI